MNKYGLLPVVVATEADLATLDKAKHTPIIAAAVGGRKKIAITEAALKAGFNLANSSQDRADKLEEDFQGTITRKAGKKERSCRKTRETRESR